MGSHPACRRLCRGRAAPAGGAPQLPRRWCAIPPEVTHRPAETSRARIVSGSGFSQNGAVRIGTFAHRGEEIVEAAGNRCRAWRAAWCDPMETSSPPAPSGCCRRSRYSQLSQASDAKRHRGNRRHRTTDLAQSDARIMSASPAVPRTSSSAAARTSPRSRWNNSSASISQCRFAAAAMRHRRLGEHCCTFLLAPDGQESKCWRTTLQKAKE